MRIGLVALVLSIIAMLFAVYPRVVSSDDVLYIDTIKAFESFELTEVVKANKEKLENSYEASLDSLKLAITMLESSASEKYQRMVYQYSELEKAKTNHLNKVVQDGDQKVWGQLNGYFKDYGKTKNCKVLLGGMGNGNILYVKEYVDLTADFVQFANEKFNGE